MNTNFIIPLDWSPQTDKVYSQAVPMPRLVGGAWWLVQSLYYAAHYLWRKISGRRYQQVDSLKNYENYSLNDWEEKLIREDRLRFLVLDGELSVGFESSGKKMLLKNLYEEIRSTADIHSILDFGCGLGLNTISVSKAFPQHHVSGFDISPVRIAFAQRMFSELGGDSQKLRVDDGTKLSLPSKSIDLIYTVLVLEQLPYLVDQALREMTRVAKKKIVLMEPSYENSSFPQKIYIRHQDYVRGLIKKAASCEGWEVQSVTMIPTFSNPLCPPMKIVLTARS